MTSPIPITHTHTTPPTLFPSPQYTLLYSSHTLGGSSIERLRRGSCCFFLTILIFKFQNMSKIIREGLAEIASEASVFYNPIQEFNRDMSIAAISTWARTYQKPSISILEGLSATGLRSIRYAKEITGKPATITANDFAIDAVSQIQKNILHNNVEEKVTASQGDAKYLKLT